MTVFRIIRHFIDFFYRVDLIIKSNGRHFVYMIIHLGTTEFLLRCKKPYILLFLQCGYILKLLYSRGSIYPNSKINFKENFNITLKPLKSSFTNKIQPYIRWSVNPLMYFFTTTAGFGDKKDESDDEESNPSESKDKEKEENMEETSDQSGCEEKSPDSTETYTDFSTALSESALSKTQHKRKAETEEKKYIKRSRSSDIRGETSNFENILLSHLEMDDKVKDNPSLPGQSGSNNTEDKMSLISVPDSNKTTPSQLTYNEIQEHPRNSETILSQQVSKVSQGSLMRGENPCGNESLFSIEGTDKSSRTLETSSQNPSHDNRLQELVSSSYTAQDWEILPSELFPGNKTCIPVSPEHKKFRRSKYLQVKYQYRSEDTCQIESRDSACFDKPVTSRSTFQHIDNRLQQDLISKNDATEEISSKSIKCHSKTNPITALSPYLIDSSASTDEDNKTCDSAIKIIHHPDNISRIFDNLPQNIAEIVSPAPSTSAWDFESKRIPDKTKKSFQTYEQKTCEMSVDESRHEKIVAFEKSSLYTHKNAGSNTMESTTGHQNSSDSNMPPWERPGCSKDPEYYPYIQSENNKGSKSIDYCRSYPGLILQPLKIKKDAIYQKKFYRQKKEIVLPVKMAKIIRWAVKVTKNLAHNVPRVSDSDEDKLPLDKYHELAQELVQGFMMAYKSTKEKESKAISDKNKKRVERKPQKEKIRKTDYIESSFQEESPSSDFSDSDISLPSQESTQISSPAPPPSPAPETKHDVSPAKSVEIVQPTGLSKKMICSPTSPNLGKSELVVTNSPEKLNYGSLSSKNFPLQPVEIKFTDLEEITSSRRVIFCRNNLIPSPCEQDVPIKLKAFFRIEKVHKPEIPCLSICVEEFLKNLLDNQKEYYELLYDESAAFYRHTTLMTRCVIPLRNIESEDDDYELVGDSLKLGTSKLKHTSAILDSCDNVLPPAPKSLITCHRQTQKGQSISVKENLKADNSRQINEGGLSQRELNEAESMNVIDTAVPETDYSFKASLKPLCQDTGNQSSTIDIIPWYSCKNNSPENLFEEASIGPLEEREFAHCKSRNIPADLKILEHPFMAKTFNKNDFTEMSEEQQSKIWKTPEANLAPDEIPKGFSCKRMFEEEQTAILESLRKSLWETTNKMICTKSSGAQQNEIFGSPRVSSISKETVNRHQFREMFENEQRAILESLSSFSEKKQFRSDCEGVSLDNESEITKSPSSVENLNKRRFTDIFEIEQRAILESFGLTKQFEDSEDLGYKFGAMEYETPKELNISSQNFSEVKSTCESFTYCEDKLRNKGGPSTSTEVFLRDENIADSVIPTMQTAFRNENICPRSGLTHFPIIIDVRHISSSESENEETCSPSSSKEINTGVNRPSCTSGADSISEQNLSPNIELELSLDSLETDAISISPDEKSENTKDTQSS